MMHGNTMGGGAMMGSGMGWGMAFGWLFFIVLTVLAVLAVLWFLRRTNLTNQSTRQPTETPLTILQRRFALGEIDAQQFTIMKSQLSENYGKT